MRTDLELIRSFREHLQRGRQLPGAVVFVAVVARDEEGRVHEGVTLSQLAEPGGRQLSPSELVGMLTWAAVAAVEESAP